MTEMLAATLCLHTDLVGMPVLLIKAQVGPSMADEANNCSKHWVPACCCCRFQSHEHNADDKGAQGRVSGEQREGKGRSQASPALALVLALLPYLPPSHTCCLDPEEN